MSEQQVVDALAEKAVEPIQNGMLVGLGTGRTARRGIRALADRVRLGGLQIDCVSTSEASESLAIELGLKVRDFALVEKVDYLFDGADEVDAKLRLIKGSGGAMTRERMIAWAADRSVYMVDESKLVDHLGENNALGVAVMAFGVKPIRSKLRSLGLNGVMRTTINGELFVTDNGNLIIDVTLEPDYDLEELAAELNDIPGVIDHGLFLTEADELLIEFEGGKIERRIREDD